MLPTVIIHDGDRRTDLCEEFGLVWTNDSVLSPPEAMTNMVSVPGMDGALDLTEVLTDDVVFGMRNDEYVFYVRDGEDFERVKTRLCNFLHGRSVDYELSVDPGYTYHGRWVCESYFSRLNYREIKFNVTANPYKRGEHKRYVIKGAGGTRQKVENGRRHVIPTVTVQGPTLVSYEGRSWELGTDEPGSYTIDGLRLAEGTSEVYVNSAPDLCDTTIQMLQDRYGTMDKVADVRIADLMVTKIDPPKDTQYDVVLEYDVQDL